MNIYFAVIIGLLLIVLFMQVVSYFMMTTYKDRKENEYYTDYRHNNLVLRVYKPEFEYQAVGKVPVEKLLDRGTLSKYYDWVLIEL